MTLPTDVVEAVAKADQYAGTYEHGFAVKNAWDTIRAHLLSQDAEIERLSQESAQQFIRARDWAELSGKNEDRASLAESRLAVANALLSRCFMQIGELTKGLDPHDPIYVELQQLGLDWMQHSEADTDHLSENAHDRA